MLLQHLVQRLDLGDDRAEGVVAGISRRGDAGEKQRCRRDQRREALQQRRQNRAKPAAAEDLADLRALLRHHHEGRLAACQHHCHVIRLERQVLDFMGGKRGGAAR